MKKILKIALIAHDSKKFDMIKFCKDYSEALVGHKLWATGTTGKRIMENTDLKIKCMKSGPLGGDQEIGALVANGKLDMVIFFRDPLAAQPHEPDVSALIRLCDVYEIPLATNKNTAKFLADDLIRMVRGDFEEHIDKK